MDLSLGIRTDLLGLDHRITGDSKEQTLLFREGSSFSTEAGGTVSICLEGEEWFPVGIPRNASLGKIQQLVAREIRSRGFAVYPGLDGAMLIRRDPGSLDED